MQALKKGSKHKSEKTSHPIIKQDIKYYAPSTKNTGKTGLFKITSHL